MFENIGGKIKTLATVITIFGMFFSVIIGFVCMLANFLAGILVIILGVLFSWIGSFLAYGFGELIDKVSYIAECARKQENSNQGNHTNFMN